MIGFESSEVGIYEFKGIYKMNTFILVTGIVLSAIWLLAVVIMEKKKRKVWLIAGAVISLLMLLYTQQWKLFLWGIVGGVVGGSGLIGKRLDRIREFHA